MAKDFYAILGVPRNVNDEQIRLRFHQLARERHPDRFQGERKLAAEADFQEITQAFNTLSDPERRRQHDLDLTRRQESATNDPRQASRIYLQRGVRAYRERNFVEAAESFDRATHSDPTNAQAWHHLAMTCAQNQVWLSRGVAAIERACELEPMNAAYLKQAGRILALAGRNERAADYYRKAIEWGETDPDVYRALDELTRGSKRGLFGKTTG